MMTRQTAGFTAGLLALGTFLLALVAPTGAMAQLATELPLRSGGGALFAHSNAIDLRDTRTYRASNGRIDWNRVIEQPGGSVVNRGSSAIRFILFLRPGVVGRKVHHYGQTMELRGGPGGLQVSVGPEGFSFAVGAADTPIWKTAVIPPNGKVELARMPTPNAEQVRKMMSAGAFQVAVLALAEDGTLLGTVAGFAPLNLGVFALDAEAGTTFVPGSQFVPGELFLPGCQYLPGDLYIAGTPVWD